MTDETLAELPQELLLAHRLVRLLAKADRDRAERELAELPRAERRRRLNEGHRRNLAAINANAPAGIRADVAARLERARARVTRRVERYARQVVSSPHRGSARPHRSARDARAPAGARARPISRRRGTSTPT